MKASYFHTITLIGKMLDKSNVPYQYTGQSALFVQGVEVDEYKNITIDVQWDVFNEVFELFSKFAPTQPEKNPESSSFLLGIDGVTVTVRCLFNMTIKTDPYRLSIKIGEMEIWCRSLYSYLYDEEMKKYSAEIHAYLSAEQQGFTAENEQAWNQNNYLALVNRYGKPKELASKIRQNPKWRLHPFYKYMGDVTGKKITHLMGSNGVKAVAMAIIGANVKVVDFSQENATFANELAKEADVTIEYIISDVLSLSSEHVSEKQDLVLMELGVLHYLIDLQPLFEKIKMILKPGGRFILHEFHPISTKLITSNGKKHKVAGNYFAPAIENNEVAFSKHMPDEEKESLSKVVQRKWTIGELITAVGQSGLAIKVLEEEPNHKIHDIGLPKTYTLVAERV
ncbi:MULTISPECIES: bifunctional 2-polyprenyl-6-hydroxyphenol methylase/3-demethylubiquinol 3-O-methyltransferase UbiG [unclassified Peribacillus]|uniref:class I SAM-dependent methyltransferase n=1 Tax=unclassified Peribacillus TaxID=2675266 RepID=UPI001F5B7CF2|nr:MULTISPECIES: methyltransferase domain-containing protein [unclassified Peribacillus]WMX55659.1 methyltransferase domain-containing protein [Peribacillus sp. R9-11]